MESDAFLQCLNYISATATAKSLVEQYLAPLSALTGAVVGFSINKVSDLIKVRSEKSDKRKTIMDDVVRVRELAAYSLATALNMWDIGVQNNMPKLYELPHKINSYCIDEYFVPLSHTYTKNQCDAMFSTMEKLQFLNIMLSKCYEETPKNPNQLIALSHNVIKMAAAIYDLTGRFINNIPATKEQPILAVIDGIGLPESDFVQKLRRAAAREDSLME
jgi:hypothetical protein